MGMGWYRWRQSREYAPAPKAGPFWDPVEGLLFVVSVDAAVPGGETGMGGSTGGSCSSVRLLTSSAVCKAPIPAPRPRPPRPLPPPCPRPPRPLPPGLLRPPPPPQAARLECSRRFSKTYACPRGPRSVISWLVKYRCTSVTSTP